MNGLDYGYFKSSSIIGTNLYSPLKKEVSANQNLLKLLYLNLNIQLMPNQKNPSHE